MWWSSTTTCSSPTWRCANRAWPSCCRRVRVVVFDEAHQLNETGVQFLGAQLGSGQVLDFARDMLAAGLQHARGLVDWQQLRGGDSSAARANCGWRSGKQWPGAKLRWAGPAPEGVRGRCVAGGARCAAAGLRRGGRAALDTVSELVARFRAAARARAQLCAERARALRQALRRRSRCAGSTWARSCAWSSRRWTSPRRCAHACSRPAQERRGASGPRLGLHLGHAGRRSEAALVHRALRPGRCRGAARRQPLRLRAPGGALRAARVSQAQRSGAQRAASRALAARAARPCCGGRTLVLTTTLRALRAIGDAMRQQLRAHGRRRAGPKCWCRANCPSAC